MYAKHTSCLTGIMMNAKRATRDDRVISFICSILSRHFPCRNTPTVSTIGVFWPNSSEKCHRRNYLVKNQHLG